MTSLEARIAAPHLNPRGGMALIPRVRALARCLCGDREAADALARAALVRACLDHHPPGPAQAREMRIFAIVCDLFQSMAPTPGPIPRGDERRGFERALAKLTRHQRLALALVDGALRSHGEAAALCGCAPGTIASRVSRGRQRLAMFLTDPSP